MIVALDDEDGDEAIVAVDYSAVAQHADGRSFASLADRAVLDVEDQVLLAADDHQHSAVGVDAFDVEVDADA